MMENKLDGNGAYYFVPSVEALRRFASADD